MGHSIKQCERLVLLANDDGYITFDQIQKEFPGLDNDDIYDWIGDSFKKTSLLEVYPIRSYEGVMLFWEQCPDDYVKGYQFKPTDTFVLSVPGENLLYQLKKERCHKILSITAALGGIAAMIQLVLYLWQSL